MQDALVRAVESLDDLRDTERVVPWFYRILRNGIIDAYRRRDVRQRRTTSLGELDVAEEMDDATDRALCECFAALIPTLRPEYGEVLTALDLGSEQPADVARRLGITTNNLKVRRHRARAALRERLKETCRTCSVHGCLDCTCDAAPPLEV